MERDGVLGESVHGGIALVSRTSGRCLGCVAPCSGSAPAVWTAGTCPSSAPPRTATPPPRPMEAHPLREAKGPGRQNGLIGDQE